MTTRRGGDVEIDAHEQQIWVLLCRGMFKIMGSIFMDFMVGSISCVIPRCLNVALAIAST
jgi:hypothetical protein